MARRFLFFFRKKRGSRATGSERLGRLGEALFYTAILVLGGAALALIIWTMIVPQWRANYGFRETTCRVLDVPLPEENHGMESTTYRPQVHIEYVVDGKKFDKLAWDQLRTWYNDQARVEALTKRFRPGETYNCWYDPNDPEQVVLIRGSVWWVWLLAMLPAAFFVFGLIGLARNRLQSRTSRERRSALAKRAANMELFEPQRRESPKFPTVPIDAEWRNSPGTALAYRLPIATKPSWQLFAAAMSFLVWNLLAAVLLTIAIRGHVARQPDWFLTFFCLPIVAAGGWLCYYFLRQFLITAGVGATRMEVSDHPLLPGEEYEILLSQAGKLTFSSLEVFLVCDEQATYRQGTDTVADSQQVCRMSILRNEHLQIQPGLPYETRCKFRVPAGAMHSFKCDNNAISWRLLVRANVARWPDYERSFPVIIHPRGGEAAAGTNHQPHDAAAGGVSRQPTPTSGGHDT
ncbi:MAG: DUF3592 domain-containing protein [Planctomycetia bacterium]|nr:DUF3592 domain-containing protein [Planctomycetia bacterium]